MDENGLELSLGLSFGGSSGKQKGKASSSDVGAGENDRGDKLVNDLKGFLDAGKNKLDSTPAPTDNVVRPSENFFSDLSKDIAGTDEEVGIEENNKRKMLFDEISHQRKHPTREPTYSDTPDKSRPSHISINTDVVSVADNEDLAESEAAGSTSKLISLHNMKNIHDYNQVGNLTYGLPCTVQQMNFATGSQTVTSRDCSPLSVPGPPLYPPSVTRHPLPVAENEQPGIKAMTSGSAPVISGYSSVQLPVMDYSWAFAPHAAYTSKGPAASALSPANPNSSSEVAHYGRNGRMTEMARGDGKQHSSEEGSSTLADNNSKAGTDNLLYAAIKPGMEAELKFGGCGSLPNLPWVSTTGQGPNGRTISGVSYRKNADQVRIVCACHGSHLSLEEFVRHASEEKADPENSTAAFTAAQNNSPSASAQS